MEIKFFIKKMKKIFINSLIIAFVFLPSCIQASISNPDSNTFYENQYYLNSINLTPYTINHFARGKDVTVAVIDEGVWLQHPDLENATWINNNEIPDNGIDDDNNGFIDDYYGWNFLDNNKNLTSKGYHGTAVAGIIAARDNNVGIMGIASEANIMSLIVCDDSGCDSNAIKNAIFYAANNGADIINLSLGANGYLGYDNSFDDAIEYAYSKDLIIVASAGNGDLESAVQKGQDLSFLKASPVNNEGNLNMIIGVGSLDSTSQYRTSWSNYGSGVDIYAPGEDIISTVVPAYSDGYGYDSTLDGTSFSAPMVSGAAALLKSQNLTLKNYEIIELLLASNKLDIQTALENSREEPEVAKVADKEVYSNGKLTVWVNYFISATPLYIKGEEINQKIPDSYIKINSSNKSQIEINIGNLSLSSGDYKIYTKGGRTSVDFSVVYYSDSTNSDDNKKNVLNSSVSNENSGDSLKEYIENEKELVVEKDDNLSEKLKGKILLQVENHGEAWYVNPKNGKKYYMANGGEAYRVMRYLGVGITNNDLENIKNDKSFAKKNSGKIFLQVESHGEAYYVDFDDGYNYLKDGDAAYEIMRSFGLGITNNDLRKIEVDEI